MGFGAEKMRQPGQHMRAEIGEAPAVFSRTAKSVVGISSRKFRAIYTIARGSSDAAANILSYEFMRELGCPMTSLPPSVFSLGDGVSLADSAVLMISQSGASDDLVRSAIGANAAGAYVMALTNVPGSDVENAADLVIPIDAGPELAVPATKTVIGSVAAGMALLAGLVPKYSAKCDAAARCFSALEGGAHHSASEELATTLLQSDSVFVIGRGCGFGAAQEIALKLKETCALHAEAYSASEVLHGPLQLVTKPLTVLILDTEEGVTTDSIDIAESRFRASGAKVFRLKASEIGGCDLTPAAAAALLLLSIYWIILDVACSLGLDPDVPDQLAKVTRTV